MADFGYKVTIRIIFTGILVKLHGPGKIEGFYLFIILNKGGKAKLHKAKLSGRNEIPIAKVTHTRARTHRRKDRANP